MYKGFEHQNIEVGMAVASPYFKKVLKDAQRLKWYPAYRNFPTLQNYQRLKFPTIVYWRNGGDATLAYKLMRN